MRLARIAWAARFAIAVAAVGPPVARAADEPDAARVAAIAALLPKRPAASGHPLADRAAWEAVAQLKAARGIVREAKKLVDKPLPDLSDEVWLDFSKTGNRARGQDVIHARHGRLPRLVLAECVEHRGMQVPDMHAVLDHVVAEVVGGTEGDAGLHAAAGQPQIGLAPRLVGDGFASFYG